MSASVLIIEDNPSNLELMSYLLVAFGHKVSKAMDGVSGLKVAQSDHFDVILCDIQLPGMPGEEIARRLKGAARTEKTPLIAVTALAMLGDRDRLLSAGFDGYISKPIDPETFVPQVERFADTLISAPRHAVTAPDSPKKAEQVRGRILVLDDSAEARYFLRFLLEPVGYCVEQATRIEEAITAAYRFHPDLIIVDMNLADGENGEQFLARVKQDEDLKNIPVIVITSSHQPSRQAMDRVKSRGAEEFLVRPLAPEILLDAIQSVLRT
jgi:two-component system cell cycle response regulator